MGLAGIKSLYHIEDEVHRMTPAKKAHYDDTDVETALKSETEDGSGFDTEDELPESNFESFSEEGVENDHDGDNAGDDQEDGK